MKLTEKQFARYCLYVLNEMENLSGVTVDNENRCFNAFDENKYKDVSFKGETFEDIFAMHCLDYVLKNFDKFEDVFCCDRKLLEWIYEKGDKNAKAVKYVQYVLSCIGTSTTFVPFMSYYDWLEFYGGEGDYFTIYQLKNKPSLAKYRFIPYEKAKVMPEGISGVNYNIIYHYPLEGRSLDDIFEMFNINRPNDFKGHSLSVSDVIVITTPGGKKAYYVDSFGFKEVEDFFVSNKIAVNAIKELIDNAYDIIARDEINLKEYINDCGQTTYAINKGLEISGMNSLLTQLEEIMLDMEAECC